MMVEEFQWQMIAYIIEMILIDHIADFVQLYARFLRVNFRLPAYVDDANTFKWNEYDEKYRYYDTFCRPEEYRYRPLFILYIMYERERQNSDREEKREINFN